jgi:hypothetical protein
VTLEVWLLACASFRLQDGCCVEVLAWNENYLHVWCPPCGDQALSLMLLLLLISSGRSCLVMVQTCWCLIEQRLLKRAAGCRL